MRSIILSVMLVRINDSHLWANGENDFKDEITKDIPIPITGEIGKE